MNYCKSSGRLPVIILVSALSILASCSGNNDQVRDSFALFQQQKTSSREIHSVMVEDESYGAYERWMAKPVLESRPLQMFTSQDSEVIENGAHPVWLLGEGSLSKDMSLTHSGNGSIRLDCPASTAKKKDTNRNYGTPEIVCPLDMEDIGRYNRISCWVYVDAPGYYNSFLGFKLYNNGDHIIPVPGRFEGEHCFTVVPGQWTHIVWEIPDLYRDKVSGISANIMMMGETSSSTSLMSLYLDEMCLERVEEDVTRGFDIRKDAVAYSHSGYRAASRKQAVAQFPASSPLRFVVVDSKTRKTVFRSSTEVLQEPGKNGEYFHVADFTNLNKEGFYYVKFYGDRTVLTDVFPIGKNAYVQTAWRNINYFYSERCGFDLPGVHEKCHTDVEVVHPDGRSINWGGGWHDAADVSQGPGNNNEAILALLNLAAATDDESLRERSLEEARWGLDWNLRTRFGDGYRANSLIIGIWTRNIKGDKDDMHSVATRNPEMNFRCAEAFAMAASAFKEKDQVFARWCRNAAVEDFRFAVEDLEKTAELKTDFNAMAASSAMRLYQLESDKKYLDFAAERMKVVLSALEETPVEGWRIPLRGFFYEDSTRSRIQAYYHQSQENRPAQVLKMLLEAAPEHEDAPAWKAACEAMAEYYTLTADLTAPYGMSPAAIYEVGNTDYSKLYHEGERIGLPTMEEYNAQVRNGVLLADSVYLRKFPVAYQFRGFNAVTLAKAEAMFALADVTGSSQLRDIATRQVEWIVGFNPYAASTIYGDGYDYHPLYGAYAGNVVGAVPVGIETFENDDEPYWPTQVNATYKEIWTHSTARMIAAIAELMKIQ